MIKIRYSQSDKPAGELLGIRQSGFAEFHPAELMQALREFGLCLDIGLE